MLARQELSVPYPVACFAAPGADKAAKGGGAGAAGFVRTEAGLNELYMRAVEPKPHVVPGLSTEEAKQGRDLAVTYTKMMWRRHHVRNRDMQRKLNLKWAALSALPTLELKREALQIDPFVPMWTRVPAVTPPSKGFHAESAAAEVVEEAATPAAAAGTAAKPSGAASKEERKKTAQLSLAAAVRRGRGRVEEDDESLFGLGAIAGAAPAAEPSKPAAAAAPIAAAAGKGKKK